MINKNYMNSLNANCHLRNLHDMLLPSINKAFIN